MDFEFNDEKEALQCTVKRLNLLAHPCAGELRPAFAGLDSIVGIIN